ncbi:MAG: amino acid carrier protein [Chlamydiales bacterium]|nr:amino acid carrier protein [Chlamydiales bacterium]
MNFTELLSQIHHSFTLFIIFPAIVLLGGYLTLRLRVPQATKLALSAKLMLQKSSGTGSISHYQAMSSVLAGNFGTGNISGIAIALTTGGPGALVWMWIMAFFGAAIQYASCYLGVKYRKQGSNGEFSGGPMYYLSHGLGQKALAICFCVATMLAAFTVGNLAQVHSISLPLKAAGLDPITTALIITISAFGVILGGIKRVARVASAIVPLKAVLYLGTGLVILCMHSEKVLPALSLMFEAAFDMKSAASGIVGFGIAQAISSGFDRGLFATDAGTGIVPILQSSARSKNPVLDGVVTLVAPFLVMTVCTMTGLVLIITGACDVGLKSTDMVTYAFQTGLNSSFGFYVVMVSLMLFAYTTVIAWAYCGQKAVGFMWPKGVKIFQYCYIAAIPIGGLLHVDLIWGLADMCISLMLLINVIGVGLLSKEVITASREYFAKPAATPITAN